MLIFIIQLNFSSLNKFVKWKHVKKTLQVLFRFKTVWTLFYVYTYYKTLQLDVFTENLMSVICPFPVRAHIYLFFRFRFWFKRIGVDKKHLSWLLVIIETAFFDFFQIFSAGNDGWYFGNGESTSNLNKDWDNNTKTAQHWRLSSCSPDSTTNSKTTVWLSNAMMSWRKSSGGPWETSCGGFSVK